MSGYFSDRGSITQNHFSVTSSKAISPGIHEKYLEAVQKPAKTLYISAAVALIGALQFGFMGPQLNVPEYNDDEMCRMTPVPEGQCVIFPGHSKLSWQLAINAWILGGAIGSLLSKYPANKLGRKNTIRFNSLLMALGSVLMTVAPGMWLLIIGRLICGLACGTSMALAGTYINEIAPPHLRGLLGCGIQMGCVTMMVVLALLQLGFYTSSTWRYIMVVPAILAAVQFLLSPFTVESPYWLVARGRTEEAKAELGRLFGSEAAEDVLAEITSEDENLDDKIEEVEGKKSSIFDSEHRRQLIVAVGHAIFQQISGINAVFYYSSTFLANAGISDPKIGNVAIDVVNALATLVAVFAADRFGRRSLLLLSGSGMLVVTVLMTITLITNQNILAIVATCLYVSFFEFGLGPIPFMLAGEIFEEDLRSSAVGFANAFNWMGNLVIGICYPFIQSALGNYSFLPFTATLTLHVLFTFFTTPETAKLSFEQIKAKFAGN